MKFEISLEATLDEETGKLTASLKGDLPDGLMSAIEKLETTTSKVVDQQLAAKAEAKTLK